jgi:hypothetical protein
LHFLQVAVRDEITMRANLMRYNSQQILVGGALNQRKRLRLADLFQNMVCGWEAETVQDIEDKFEGAVYVGIGCPDVFLTLALRKERSKLGA